MRRTSLTHNPTTYDEDESFQVRATLPYPIPNQPDPNVVVNAGETSQ